MIRVVMLVHGMGCHDPKWCDDAKESLRTAAASYNLPDEFSDEIANNKIALIPIVYDDRFQSWVNRWGNDSRAFAAYIKTNGIGVPANLVSWLENADKTENNFLWTHVVDVILYRFFSLVTTDVRVHVMQQVARVWKDALSADPNAEVTIVAHSLGTSVVHDSLGLLATDPPPGADGFLAGDVQLANIFMVANVSRILETNPKAYDS